MSPTGAAYLDYDDLCATLPSAWAFMRAFISLVTWGTVWMVPPR